MSAISEQVGKYFPTEVVKELTKDLSGKEYRLTIVEKDMARDLNMICSHREIKRIDTDDKELLNIEDSDIVVYYGNLTPGDITSHTKLMKSGKFESLNYRLVEPIIGKEPILMVKSGVKSDRLKGYFNHKYNAVYIIK